MREEKIAITLADTGALSVELKGFKGPVCEKEVLRLLQGIAAVADPQRTAEYYERPPEAQVRRHSQAERRKP